MLAEDNEMTTIKRGTQLFANSKYERRLLFYGIRGCNWVRYANYIGKLVKFVPFGMNLLKANSTKSSVLTFLSSIIYLPRYIHSLINISNLINSASTVSNRPVLSADIAIYQTWNNVLTHQHFDQACDMLSTEKICTKRTRSTVH